MADKQRFEVVATSEDHADLNLKLMLPARCTAKECNRVIETSDRWVAIRSNSGVVFGLHHECFRALCGGFDA